MRQQEVILCTADQTQIVTATEMSPNQIMNRTTTTILILIRRLTVNITKVGAIEDKVLKQQTRGDDMIDNHELPIGFTMELAQHSDILNQFATLPKTEQISIVNGAKEIKSHDEMRNYVKNMFR